MEAVAKYNFNATAEDELSFKKSQILKIFNMENEKKWYLAELDGKEGMVPSNYIEMKYHRWYYGKITRPESEMLLMEEYEGAFLIRMSTTIPGQFLLSVKCLGTILHFKILRDAQYEFFLWFRKFNSINALVKFYRTWSVCRSRVVLLREKAQQHFLVKALHNFQPQEPGELKFRRGDIITVKNRSNQDWWYGEIEDNKGLFPATYVKLIPTQSSPSSRSR